MTKGKTPDFPAKHPIARGILFSLLALGLFHPTLSASQDTKRKEVLVLFSFRPTLPVAYQWDRGIRSVLESDPSHVFVINIEYLHLDRFNDDDYVRWLIQGLRQKYSGSEPDLIIPVFDVAVDLILRYGEELFPGVPIVLGGVENHVVENRSIGSNVTGVLTDTNYTGTLDLVLRLHPNTSRVVAVAGADPMGRSYAKAAREALRAYEDRIEIDYLIGLPMGEILERTANLPARTVVLYLNVLKDGAGKAFVGIEALSQIASVSSAPVYSLWDATLGHGIVGGYLSCFEKQAEAVAETALRILNGEKPGDISTFKAHSCQYMFDGRQLKRWSIPDDRLPPGSIVQFTEPNFWEQHRGPILIALAAFLLQTLVIAYLMYQHRKRLSAEEALSHSESKYRTVADYTYDWEYWEDSEGRLKYISPSCERISGYSAEDFVEDPSLFRQIIVPEDREIWEHHRCDSGRGSRSESIEFRIQRKDGEIRWVEHLCQAVHEEQEGLLGVRGSNRDVTGRKQAELDARMRREEITHVSRTLTLGEIAASLGHEINQPLTATLSYAQAAKRFLAAEAPDLDEVGNAVDGIVAGSRRAQEVVGRIRMLMTKQAPERSRIDVKHLVGEAVEMTRRTARDQAVSIRLDLPRDLPHVFGDRVQLEQVILNLLLNGFEAIRAAEKGHGELIVRASKDETDYVTVSVEDSGIGIDGDNQEPMFDAFFTTKPEGMGMGLSISRSIIEDHGGRLWAARNPVQGATFSFTVPIHEEDLP